VAKDGRPQILEAPSQKAEEQRIEKREDDPDRASLCVGEPKEHRRQHNSHEYANRAGAGHVSDPKRQMAAVDDLLANCGQIPGDGKKDQQGAEVALEPRELAEILALTCDAVQDRHGESELKQVPGKRQPKQLRSCAALVDYGESPVRTVPAAGSPGRSPPTGGRSA
jgi:hypothetical protein